jgi:hypothetical protein
VKKDHIFWIVWGVVVLGAGAFHVFSVSPLREKNATLNKEKTYLASRFIGLEETRRLQWLCASPAERKAMKLPKATDEDAKYKRDFDPKLWRKYALGTNIRSVPNPTLLRDVKALDAKLREVRAAFARERLAEYSFAVKEDSDFGPRGKPPGNPLNFKYWVRDEDNATDGAFQAAAGEVKLELQEAQLIDPTESLRWMSDGRVTGIIPEVQNPDGTSSVQPAARKRILRRLVLRRELLLALTRVHADVERCIPITDRTGQLTGERRETVNRGIDRIASLTFLPPPGGRRGVPYVEHRIDLTVECHLAVLPALMEELESIGTERKRPFTFWVEKCVIRRASGWPISAGGTGPEKHGRSDEWPVSAYVSGIVPEFNEKLDREP